MPSAGWDRDTTGLLIIAKNNASACLLSRQVSHQLIEKEYLAAASGCVPESGTIDAPIRRADDSVIERMVNLPAAIQPELTMNGCFMTLYPTYLWRGSVWRQDEPTRYGFTFSTLAILLPAIFFTIPIFPRISRQALHSWKLRFLPSNYKGTHAVYCTDA